MKLIPQSFVFAMTAMLAITLAGTSHAAQDPQAIVKSTTEQVLSALKQEGAREDRKRVYAIIEQMVLPHFDFRKMSQWVLGKNWKQGRPEEQERFVAEFQKLLVRTYSSALMQYTDQKITYLPTQSDADGRIATVKTQVIPADGPPVPIDYRLYQREGDWKVFDVAVDGISLVANYRTSFNEEIGSKGFSGLVDALAARNQQ